VAHLLGRRARSQRSQPSTRRGRHECPRIRRRSRLHTETDRTELDAGERTGLERGRAYVVRPVVQVPAVVGEDQKHDAQREK